VIVHVSVERSSPLGRPIHLALLHWKTLAALSWLVCGALYLTLPPSADQFQHLYQGWRLLEGDILYRDFIDANWPGVMALAAAATWLFGNHLWSWRAFDLALFLASTAFLADLAKLAAGRRAGQATLILSPAVYAGVSYWLAGQHDMSAAQFLAPALWFHVQGYRRANPRFQLGTGLFIAAAMLCKPTVGVIGILLPLQALWLRFPLGRIALHTGIAGVTAVASLLVAFAALMAHGTLWSELLDAVYTYNLGAQYVGAQTLSEMMLWLVQFHYGWVPMVALGAIPALWWIARLAPASIATSAPLVLWLAGVLSFIIQWHGMAYHLAPCVLALCVLAGVSVGLLADDEVVVGVSAWSRNVAVAAILIALGAITIKLAAYYRALPSALINNNYEPHLSRFIVGDELDAAEILATVRRLETLPAHSCVLMVGDAASINYLGKRHMGTRFYYYHVLRDAPIPLAQRWATLWERDLQAADCPLALVSRQAMKEWLSQGDPAPAALRRFLQHYRPSGVIGSRGGLVAYERL
jgi:hypothetical protein